MHGATGSGIEEDSAHGWRKSVRSYGSGACVEVAGPALDHVQVRDSVNPHGFVLQVTQTGWTTFLGNILGGNFPRVLSSPDSLRRLEDEVA
jgi:hypothetical protein